LTAYEYLISRKEYGAVLPTSRDKKGEVSNSEVKRWLERRSVLINEKAPNWNEEIEFPIINLVFFYKGNRVTYL